MEKEYQKIGNVFKFDEKFRTIVGLNEPFETLKNIIWEGTEKVDGCLHSTTRIVMSDGTTKRINQIKVGDIIMGYDTDKNIPLPTTVLNVSHKSKAGIWYEIKTRRLGIGKGNYYGVIKCTEDHEIYTSNRGYIKADQLTEEDKILSIRTELSLTPIQEQVLTGKMLGDGSFSCYSQIGYISWGQKEEEYNEWCLKWLQELGGNVQKPQISGYGTKMYRARTVSSSAIYDKFIDWFIESNHKEVPKNICLTPISLAFWYMDDGALSHNEGQEDRVVFATNGFNTQSCEYLIKELKKFNINAEIYQNKGNEIRLNAENAEKLFLLIYPYICDSKKYKLPERYRDCPTYVPNFNETTYHKVVREQEIMSIKKMPTSHERWDLSTETHNFFTTGGLVHNCNIRIHWDGHNIEIAGHTDKAQIPGPLKEYLESIFLTKEMEYVFEQIFEEKDAYVFGEGFGPGIQAGGGLYTDKPSFIVFDININGFDLKRDAVNDIASRLGLPSVPVVFHGTLDEAKAYVAEHHMSTINEAHEMEGLVLVPSEIQLYDNKHHLIKCKCKYRDMVKAGLAQKENN